MDKSEIINALLENPDLMAEISKDESLSGKFEELGNDALRNSRDKAIKSNQNYRSANDELTAKLDNITQGVPDTPQSTPAKTSKDDGVDSALLKRIADLEAERDNAKAAAEQSRKREARDAALSSLPFKEGGMSMAQQVISLDSFEVQSDGSIRHKENAMSMDDYVKSDWSKTPQASLLLDSSANGGGGASGTKRTGSSLSKKYSDASPGERNQYAIENGVDAYNDWKARG